MGTISTTIEIMRSGNENTGTDDFLGGKDFLGQSPNPLKFR